MHIQLESFSSFRRFCLDINNLPCDLCATIVAIQNGVQNFDDLFPHFIAHVHRIFPHLACMDDLKHISDLRTPANWYPDARKIQRKIVFHAGPTNSGKVLDKLFICFVCKLDKRWIFYFGRRTMQ